jgi:hypothetical protein
LDNIKQQANKLLGWIFGEEPQGKRIFEIIPLQQLWIYERIYLKQLNKPVALLLTGRGNVRKYNGTKNPRMVTRRNT